YVRGAVVSNATPACSMTGVCKPAAKCLGLLTPRCYIPHPTLAIVDGATVTEKEHRMSIWCAGSSEQVYSATSLARCPVCGSIVPVTRQGHIRPHVENKLPKGAPAK